MRFENSKVILVTKAKKFNFAALMCNEKFPLNFSLFLTRTQESFKLNSWTNLNSVI